MSGTSVLAVASGKGGVGKTTTTVNLGTALAGAGNEVVVVDTDLGMANLAGFVNVSLEPATLHDVLSAEASIAEATYEVADGLSVVPSGTDLTDFASADATGLKDVVEQLRGRFDYVLLDVGAGVSHETVLPLGIADDVLLVSTPEPASIQDVQKTIQLTEQAGGSVVGLLLTRTREKDNVPYDQLAERLSVPLLGTIPEDGAVRDSVYTRTPLVVNTPDAPAARAYRKLASRVGGAPAETTTSPSESSAGTADPDEDPDDADPEGTATESDSGVTADAMAADPEQEETVAADPATSSDVSDALADVELDDAETDDATESGEDDGGEVEEDIELSLDDEQDSEQTAADLDTHAETDTDSSTAKDTDSQEAETVDGSVVVEAEADPDTPTETDVTPDENVAGATTDTGKSTVENGVTIPDAESGEDATTTEDEDATTDDEDSSVDELDDEAIPFRGGANDPRTDGETADGDNKSETADGDDKSETADGDDETTDDEKDGKGGFLRGLF